MELTFYADGQRYGFLGQKPLKEITDQVKKKDVVKVPYSGNYLYKDRSVEVFADIKERTGRSGCPDFRNSWRDEAVLVVSEQGAQQRWKSISCLPITCPSWLLISRQW